MLNMNSNHCCYPLVDYTVIKIKASFYFLASKRQDTSFRAQQVKVVDTSTEQLTVDSLLTPSE